MNIFIQLEGLSYDIMIFLDIETTSLEADTGILVAVGLCTKKTDVEINFLDSYKDEERILKDTFNKISGKTIITFNGKRFDIPFLITRGLKYGLSFPKIENIDLYYWAYKHLRLQSKKFHDICQFFDIEHEEISGREVSELFIKGISGDEEAKKRIERHLYQDVSAMKVLYQKIEKMIEEYPPPEDIYR